MILSAVRFFPQRGFGQPSAVEKEKERAMRRPRERQRKSLFPRAPAASVNRIALVGSRNAMGHLVDFARYQGSLTHLLY